MEYTRPTLKHLGSLSEVTLGLEGQPSPPLQELPALD